MSPLGTQCWEIQPDQPVLIESPQRHAVLRLQSVSLADFMPGRTLLGIRLCGDPEPECRTSYAGWAVFSVLEAGKTESVMMSTDLTHHHGPIAFSVNGPNSVCIVASWIHCHGGIGSNASGTLPWEQTSKQIGSRHALPSVSHLPSANDRTESMRHPPITSSSRPDLLSETSSVSLEPITPVKHHRAKSYSPRAHSMGSRGKIQVEKPVLTALGIKYMVVKSGEMNSGTPRDGQWVRVKVTMYVARKVVVGKKPFFTFQQQLTFQLNNSESDIIPGISIAASIMCKGEVMRATVPCSLAKGILGRHQRASADSPVSLVITLQSFGETREENMERFRYIRWWHVSRTEPGCVEIPASVKSHAMRKGFLTSQHTESVNTTQPPRPFTIPLFEFDCRSLSRRHRTAAYAPAEIPTRLQLLAVIQERVERNRENGEDSVKPREPSVCLGLKSTQSEDGRSRFQERWTWLLSAASYQSCNNEAGVIERDEWLSERDKYAAISSLTESLEQMPPGAARSPASAKLRNPSRHIGTSDLTVLKRMIKGIVVENLKLTFGIFDLDQPRLGPVD
ncbi:hypothetical protein SISNIDRAFT_469206 [Sistotremastrum niveocremeum HHB9708]|uniref:Uncharacterized protein n=1 Tax=Sistotremastrum niveocremeum HHB9708 TaxID=1314777 RepID=A0A164QIZ7_9AGAM|nr:hypothetical protein SISNIDRAFT_469206 [Sistotremastrum niveocremeum HHB9708]